MERQPTRPSYAGDQAAVLEPLDDWEPKGAGMSLEGKTALVTGGSRGIGAEIVRRLATEGADIGFTYSTALDEAERVAAQVRELGRRALVVQADLAAAEAARDVVGAVAGEFGRLDIL